MYTSNGESTSLDPSVRMGMNAGTSATMPFRLQHPDHFLALVRVVHWMQCHSLHTCWQTV